MIEEITFKSFDKIPRLSRDMIITEKLDGTNAQIFIAENGNILAGSRNRWITPENDNFGFAKWVYENKEELLKLGQGRHYGEWWGEGIQRGYNLNEKRFSLFNVLRYNLANTPSCCNVVPLLYYGGFDTNIIENELDFLAKTGSKACSYPYPEGIIIYHLASGVLFKKTILNDQEPKNLLK